MKGDEFFKNVSKKAPFSKMHPKIAAFFKDYLSNEKVVTFNNQFVLNTHFPPYPSPAFNNLAEHFSSIGEVDKRRLFSVTLAITNRCNYNCWHCYNAGRSQLDIPLPKIKKVINELQDMGTVMVILSGGEPFLRKDLEEIAGTFDNRTCLALNTTGSGLNKERAIALRENGLFAVGVSLDSTDENEHDRLRGKKGAFQTALQALQVASQSGLYPYIIAVATHDFLHPARFISFMQFAAKSGALEVHLLEPSATGKLTGRKDVLLSQEDKKLMFNYQKEIAQRDDLPIMSSFSYLESHEIFGCGAGLTHLYIDGSGEVCPCNLVPLSFGNVTKEPFQQILNRMGCYFCKPRASCIDKTLAKHFPEGHLPAKPELSIKICKEHLPAKHSVPRFFKVKAEAKGKVGQKELQSAYDQIHEYYDDFWLKKAGNPIKDLIERLSFTGGERVFEAGCGTGFATVLIAKKLKDNTKLIAVDISKGMLNQARIRADSNGFKNIQFIPGDALKILSAGKPFDIVFSSWVLGYIVLKPFFIATANALASSGQLAFIVHKENSPYEPLEIFWELVANDPSVLQKQVSFDFPQDMNYVRDEVERAGLVIKHLWEGKVIFKYNTPIEVLEHLLKSGAGTVFYDAIDPNKRKLLEDQFLEKLNTRRKLLTGYEVVHDYISCIATKP